MGAVGNGPPFSKARWARPRVHGAGSVHGLFRVDDRRRQCHHEAASARVEEVLPRRLACSVRNVGS